MIDRSSTPEDVRRDGDPPLVGLGGCGGPSKCMDDLCRNSTIGLCGYTDDDLADWEATDGFGEDWENDDE